MPDSAASLRRSASLVAIAVVLVLLIVVGPFLIVREAHRRSVEAAAAVNQTYAVEAAAQSLLYDLRDRESAALAYAFGHDSPAVRARLHESRQRLPGHLQRLTALTRDNPEQQVRVGRLSAAIEQRALAIEEILARPPGTGDRTQIAQLLDRNALRHVARGISGSEQARLRQREAESARLARRSATMTWVAMLLQLLLLASLGVLLTRITRSRRDAEHSALRSSARAQAVLQTVREPVVVLDRSLHVVMHNPAFAEVFGLRESAVGQSIDQVGDGAWSALETRQRLLDVLGRDRELWDRMLAITEEQLKAAIGKWVQGGQIKDVFKRRDVMAQEIAKLGT